MKKQAKILPIIVGVILMISGVWKLGGALMSLTGWGVSAKTQAKELVDENLKKHQTGGIQETEFESLLNVFEQAGLSENGKEKLLEAMNIMMKKMTYSIQSCAADPNNENIYIVKTELKTVGGNAIFIDEVPWDEIVSTLVEGYKAGGYNDDGMQEELLEKWFDHILEKSRAAEATKSITVDFEVEVNKDTDTLYTEVRYNKLLGLSEDFEQLLEEKSGEIDEMISSSFGLGDYVTMLNDAYKDMDNEYLSVFCTADGKTLIFTCTFKIADVTKEEAESLMESEAKAFEDLIDELKGGSIPCDKVIFEYRGIDNKLLASREEIIGRNDGAKNEDITYAL
jgi:hypothetical protein